MSKKQESVFDDPKPGRKNIWLTREIKAIIKAKIDKGEITNFSKYVESLILEIDKQELNNAAVSGSLPSEIYATYDRSDGEIFCAFIDEDQCKREAKESGCGMKTVRLVAKQ